MTKHSIFLDAIDMKFSLTNKFYPPVHFIRVLPGGEMFPNHETVTADELTIDSITLLCGARPEKAYGPFYPTVSTDKTTGMGDFTRLDFPGGTVRLNIKADDNEDTMNILEAGSSRRLHLVLDRGGAGGGGRGAKMPRLPAKRHGQPRMKDETSSSTGKMSERDGFFSTSHL